MGASRGPAGFAGGQAGTGEGQAGQACTSHEKGARKWPVDPRAAPCAGSSDAPTAPAHGNGRRQQPVRGLYHSFRSEAAENTQTPCRVRLAQFTGAPANPVLPPGPLPAPRAPPGCSPGPTCRAPGHTCGGPSRCGAAGTGRGPRRQGRARALFCRGRGEAVGRPARPRCLRPQPPGPAVTPVPLQTVLRSCSAPAQAPHSPRQTHTREIPRGLGVPPAATFP